jgi:hypothetical protein
MRAEDIGGSQIRKEDSSGSLQGEKKTEKGNAINFQIFKIENFLISSCFVFSDI